MFYKKKGLPEESELLICTVKKVLPHSVFCKLEEYENLEGMIHISEISPGRIRNIRDFVKEGKGIICKVLRVNKFKNQVDLSLRRVSPTLRTKKNSEYKQEQKAEKILNLIAKNFKLELKDIYSKIGYKLINKFGSLNEAFQSIIQDYGLKNLNLDPKFEKELIKIVKEKIKPPEVKITGILTLQSTSQNGLEIIKKSFERGLNLAKKNEYRLEVKYLSAPRYRIDLNSTDYKTAEKQLNEVSNEIISFVQENDGTGSFERK